MRLVWVAYLILQLNAIRESLLVIELKAHGFVWRWGLAFLMFRCSFTGWDLCLLAALHCHDFVTHILSQLEIPLVHCLFVFLIPTFRVERKSQKSTANAVSQMHVLQRSHLLLVE